MAKKGKATIARAERADISEHLGPFYVYLLIDPRSDQPFYVGKGSGLRYLDHGADALTHKADPGQTAKVTSRKVALIREIEFQGKPVRIDIVRHRLSEEDAFTVEAALIDVLAGLVNDQAGHTSGLGRSRLEELESRYGAPLLTTTEKAILIKLGGWLDDPFPDLDRPGYGYRRDMTRDELYRSIRGIWKLDARWVNDYPYVVAVHNRITRGLWRPKRWVHVAGRLAFEGPEITIGSAHEAFVGVLGRRIPELREDGRKVFGAQATHAYWPS